MLRYNCDNPLAARPTQALLKSRLQLMRLLVEALRCKPEGRGFDSLWD
jgi:hypothetical protein